MTDGFDPLLPAADTSVRCATHAREIGLDPGGTALWADEVIVADVALPWPKPVWIHPDHPDVAGLVAGAGAAGRRLRVLAAVPLDDGVGRVVTHRLVDGAAFARAEHRVAPAEVPALVARLVRDGLDASPATVADTAPVRELLVCTQGSHDVCCGSRGAAFEAELRAFDKGYRIRRVSHTGGHRMAPTGLTLPDGRMWGLVTAAEMAAILDRTVAPAAVAERCRGWLGAAPGPAQVAERAVFAALDDWGVDERPRRVDGPAEEPSEADSRDLVVRVGDDEWAVTVSPGRAVPTIACGEPGGLPAKPAREWRVDAIVRRG